MGQHRTTWTPDEHEHIVQVSLTSACIRTGSTFIPFRHADTLPEGELLLLDKRNGNELRVEHIPPRELTGFRNYFEHLQLKPNDQLLLKVNNDGTGEIEFQLRPRAPQSKPKAKPVAEKKTVERPVPAFLEWQPEPTAPPPPAAPQAYRREEPPTSQPAEEATKPSEPSTQESEPTASWLTSRLDDGRKWLGGLVEKTRERRTVNSTPTLDDDLEPVDFIPKAERRHAPIDDWLDNHWNGQFNWDPAKSEPTQPKPAPTWDEVEASNAKPISSEPVVEDLPAPQPRVRESAVDALAEPPETAEPAGDSHDSLVAASSEGPVATVRSYVAKPSTPAIIRTNVVADQLGLPVDEVAQALKLLCSEPDTLVSPIRADAFLVKRA